MTASPKTAHCNKPGPSHFIEHIRRLRALSKWVLSGCPSPPPHIVKLYVIWAYLRELRLETLVETGTYLGETTEWLARTGINVISIELSSDLHRLATERLGRYRNIMLLQGDSGQLLPELIASFTEPVCFWLDAHFSGGETAKGVTDTPILQELEAILEHPIRGHVILVDDARCFTGEDGYPFLDEVLVLVRKSGFYRAEVSTDIIRITPIREWMSQPRNY